MPLPPRPASLEDARSLGGAIVREHVDEINRRLAGAGILPVDVAEVEIVDRGVPTASVWRRSDGRHAVRMEASLLAQLEPHETAFIIAHELGHTRQPRLTKAGMDAIKEAIRDRGGSTLSADRHVHRLRVQREFDADRFAILAAGLPAATAEAVLRTTRAIAHAAGVLLDYEKPDRLAAHHPPVESRIHHIRGAEARVRHGGDTVAVRAEMARNQLSDGNAAAGERVMRAALVTAERAGDSRSRGLARALGAITNAQQRRPPSVWTAEERAQFHAATRTLTAESAPPVDRARAHVTLARGHAVMGNPGTALHHYDQAVGTLRSAGAAEASRRWLEYEGNTYRAAVAAVRQQAATGRSL